VILLDVKDRRSPNGRRQPVKPGRRIEIQGEIVELAMNYLIHSREMESSPRVADAIEKLDGLDSAASALSAAFKGLDEWTIKALHESLGPMEAIQVKGLSFETLAPNHRERGLDGRDLWAVRLKALADQARLASRALAGMDSGGQTNMGMQAMGTGRNFLAVSCARLLRVNHHKISFAVGGNVERLAHAILRFATGDDLPIPTAAVRLAGENDAATLELEALVRNELEGWERISSTELENLPSDVRKSIPAPPTPQDARNLLEMAQKLTRRQLGALGKRK
jgi:hypothetical protein